MISELEFMIGVMIGILAYGAGWFTGYYFGVAETERRWSDAVSKAEWHRKHGGN